MLRALLLPLLVASAVGGDLRLVTVTGLRLHAEPNASSAVVLRVPLGTVIECGERSPDVDVGGTHGAFCKVRAGDRVGWAFEPLTAPVADDGDAQLQALIDKRMGALDDAERADLYELDGLIRRQIDGTADRNLRLAARLDELRLLDKHAAVFAGDKRIYDDPSQGKRLRRAPILKLVDDARDTPVSEPAMWFLVEHGRDGECETNAGCHMDWMVRLEVRYLRAHPQGPHAGAALAHIAGTATWLVDDIGGNADLPLDDVGPLVDKARAAVAALPASAARTKAAAALDALGAVVKERAAPAGAARHAADIRALGAQLDLPKRVVDALVAYRSHARKLTSDDKLCALRAEADVVADASEDPLDAQRSAVLGDTAKLDAYEKAVEALADALPGLALGDGELFHLDRSDTQLAALAKGADTRAFLAAAGPIVGPGFTAGIRQVTDDQGCFAPEELAAALDAARPVWGKGPACLKKVLGDELNETLDQVLPWSWYCDDRDKARVAVEKLAASLLAFPGIDGRGRATRLKAALEGEGVRFGGPPP